MQSDLADTSAYAISSSARRIGGNRHLQIRAAEVQRKEGSMRQVTSLSFGKVLGITYPFSDPSGTPVTNVGLLDGELVECISL